jgi:hypothetical protein
MGARSLFGFDPARIAGAIVALTCSAVVALTGAAGLHGGDAAGVTSGAPLAAAYENDSDRPCEDYVFSLDEIRDAEKQWPRQWDDMTARAAEWSPNAKLVQLTLSCDYFDSEGNAEEAHDDINWNGVFYDPDGTEQLYWHSATGEHYFVFEEAALDREHISFTQLAEWLDDADIPGDARIASIIVTNSPGAKVEPDDHLSYVVTSITSDGQLVELTVDSHDGTVSEKTI